MPRSAHSPPSGSPAFLRARGRSSALFKTTAPSDCCAPLRNPQRPASKARGAAGRRAAAVALATSVALIGCLRVEAKAGNGVAAIFMYHHVSPTIAPGRYARALTISPAELESQLVWLREHDCMAVSVKQLLLDVGGNTRCEVALTFDDGYEDVAQFAAPLLRNYADVGTFYITTGLVSAPGHVTVAQIRTLHNAGMEMGAHTVHHVDLTALSHAQAYHEIESSQKSLQRWIGEPVSSFAYPAGAVDVAVASTVRALHFDDAVTTQPGKLTARSDRFELPRYRILRGDGLRLMAEVLGKAALHPARARSALQHIARQRIEGNNSQVAEAVAVALLARSFPEQILKIHVLALQPATVAGVVLSGVKFHRAIDAARFRGDVLEMIKATFASAPAVNEVDVWATIPIAVTAGTPVSGDYAAPTTKTVFSCAIQRTEWAQRGGSLGKIYWDAGWLPPI